MLNSKTLDGVKLVQEDYFATDAECDQYLESAYVQGSQGWGIRRDMGVTLRLARDLKIALELASKADEAQRTLKGLQLENGRLKKQAAVSSGIAVAYKESMSTINEQVAEIGELRDEIVILHKEIVRLNGIIETSY